MGRNREEKIAELMADGYIYRHLMEEIDYHRSAMRQAIAEAIDAGISVSDIAEASGLSRVTIYNLKKTAA